MNPFKPDCETIPLWEILVPTVSNKGKPFRTRYHRVWDEKVRELTGGLTVLKPVKGQWVAPEDNPFSQATNLFIERMIPVRIWCSHAKIEKIADMTAEYYDQLAVMFYIVSNYVKIKTYPKPVV